MALATELLEILACPDDKGPLYYLEGESVLYNPRLRRRYDIRDDIPVMLIDESTIVDDARTRSPDGHRRARFDRRRRSTPVDARVHDGSVTIRPMTSLRSLRGAVAFAALCASALVAVGAAGGTPIASAQATSLGVGRRVPPGHADAHLRHARRRHQRHRAARAPNRRTRPGRRSASMRSARAAFRPRSPAPTGTCSPSC